MPKKPAAKKPEPRQPRHSYPGAPAPRRSPLLALALAAVVVAAGLFYLKSSSQDSPTPPADPVGVSRAEPVLPVDPPPPQAPVEAGPPAADLAPVPEAEPAGASIMLPPLPMTPYPPARSPDVVSAVYQFAAEHGDVLKYVPCFCGCEQHGHRANEDCFVASRGTDGRITWDAHGLG